MRKNTIIAVEDTHLGVIHIPYYEEFISVENNKIKMKETIFLVESFFFNSIRIPVFKKRYFNTFINKEYRRGDIIYREKEIIEYIYFTKEGEIELTFRVNFLELNKIIRILQGKFNIELNYEDCYTLKNGKIFLM